MNISLIVLVLVVLFFIAAFVYVIFFKPKGRKVQLEFYETYFEGQPVRINPEKKIYGCIMRDQGKEYLRIPKKYSKATIPGVSSRSIMPTKGKFDIVRLLKVGEALYVPLECTIDTKAAVFRESINEQSEPISWMLNENEKLNDRYRNESWFAKYGPLVTLGIIVIGGLLAIYSTGQQINELNDDYRQQTLGEINEQRSFVLDLVNNIKGEEQNKPQETDVIDKPPNAG